MGTRAAFWIGNPENIESREWLGCKAFDGYPDSFKLFGAVKTEGAFRVAVSSIAENSPDDFAKPDGGWPYPWDDDIFLTDYTYAFFDGAVQVTAFHSGWKPYKVDWDEDEDRDGLPSNVPAPSKYNSKQPDSIIIIGT